MLFREMGIDTADVLAAARTKWNFVPVRPGLVGGHCIPVDPYYLTYAAQQIGFNSDLILAGRRINDSMAEYVASATLKLLADSRGDVTGRGVLILGAAFKEDVRDARNSQVWVLARLLQENGARVLVHDPVLGREIIEAAGFDAVDDPFEAAASAAAVVLAVPHAAFRRRSLDEIIGLFEPGEGRPVLVDVYGVLKDAVAAHDHVSYWSL
jgi:UDP-N-acetyl-D-galactosamine dehydrogenase